MSNGHGVSVLQAEKSSGDDGGDGYPMVSALRVTELDVWSV